MSFNQLSTCSLVPTYHDDETVFKGNVTYSLCYQHPNECTNIITYMWPITITYSTRTSAGIGVEIGNKKSDREGEGVITDYVLSSAMVCEDESCTSQRTNTHFKVSENIIIKHSSTEFELDFDRMILKRNENLEDWTHNTKVIAFEPLILETFAPAKCIGYTCEFDVESNVDHARNLQSSRVKYRKLQETNNKVTKASIVFDVNDDSENININTDIETIVVILIGFLFCSFVITYLGYMFYKYCKNKKRVRTRTNKGFNEFNGVPTIARVIDT